MDGTGAAYATGYTRASNFPTQDPLQATLTSGQGSDAWVTKVNAAGNALVYSTYLGGSSNAGAQVDDAATASPSTATATLTWRASRRRPTSRRGFPGKRR